jgi:ferredoxin
MPEPLRLRVDRELCIGAATCAGIAPGVFALDEEELAYVVDPAGGSEEEIRTAAERCPSGAIYVDE